MGLWGRAFVIWCGFFVLAMLNGALREAGIKRLIGEPWAHHLSVLTAIILFGIYAWLLRAHLDLRSLSDAIQIGLFWLVLTVLAETFIVGRLLGKHSWDVILANYDIVHGNLWPLVVLWVGILPALLHRYGGNK
ncbi:MAG TPA: hypothetical protein VFH43_03825 [Candidatus Kapabacteria bacterium]|nr:hypothetical protein [Candidatus Kapabacteria bacterium]